MTVVFYSQSPYARLLLFNVSHNFFSTVRIVLQIYKHVECWIFESGKAQLREFGLNGHRQLQMVKSGVTKIEGSYQLSKWMHECVIVYTGLLSNPWQSGVGVESVSTNSTLSIDLATDKWQCSAALRVWRELIRCIVSDNCSVIWQAHTRPMINVWGKYSCVGDDTYRFPISFLSSLVEIVYRGEGLKAEIGRASCRERV